MNKEWLKNSVTYKEYLAREFKSNKFKNPPHIEKTPQTVESVVGKIEYMGDFVINNVSGRPLLIGYKFKYDKEEIICRPYSNSDKRIVISYQGKNVTGLLGDILKIYLTPILKEKLTYSKEFDINEEDLFKYVEDTKDKQLSSIDYPDWGSYE